VTRWCKDVVFARVSHDRRASSLKQGVSFVLQTMSRFVKSNHINQTTCCSIEVLISNGLQERRSILISTLWTSRPQLSEGTCRRENIRGKTPTASQPRHPTSLRSTHTHTRHASNTILLPDEATLYYIPHPNSALAPLMVIRRRSAQVLLQTHDL
jgi:hypothetical protein